MTRLTIGVSMNFFNRLVCLSQDLKHIEYSDLVDKTSIPHKRIKELVWCLKKITPSKDINSIDVFEFNQLRYNLCELKERFHEINVRRDKTLEKIVEKINSLIILPELPSLVLMEISEYFSLELRTLSLLSATTKEWRASTSQTLLNLQAQVTARKYTRRQLKITIDPNALEPSETRALVPKKQLEGREVELFVLYCSRWKFLSLQGEKILNSSNGMTCWTNLHSVALDCFFDVNYSTFKRLKCLTNLRKLQLSNCRSLRGTNLRPLSVLTNLEVLELNGCVNLLASNLNYLIALSALRQLELVGYIELKNRHLQGFSSLSKLTSLILKSCMNLKDRGIGNLTGLTDLEILELSSNRPKGTHVSSSSLITDRSLQYIKAFTNLRLLRLYDCHNFSTEGLKYLTNHTKLQVLTLKNYAKLTDIGFRHLRWLTNLTNLDLSHSLCYRFDSELLERQLNLNYTGLRYLEALGKLRHLFITHYTKIHVEGYSEIVELMISRLSQANPNLCITKLRSDI